MLKAPSQNRGQGIAGIIVNRTWIRTQLEGAGVKVGYKYACRESRKSR